MNTTDARALADFCGELEDLCLKHRMELITTWLGPDKEWGVTAMPLAHARRPVESVKSILLATLQEMTRE